MFQLKTFFEYKALNESTLNNTQSEEDLQSFEEKHLISPLHIAIKERNVDAIIALIERGEDVNAKNSFGYTPLHWAVEENSYQLVEFLLMHGANMDSKNMWGESPLDRAKTKSDKKVYQLLAVFSKEIKDS